MLLDMSKDITDITDELHIVVTDGKNVYLVDKENIIEQANDFTFPIL